MSTRPIPEPSAQATAAATAPQVKIPDMADPEALISDQDVQLATNEPKLSWRYGTSETKPYSQEIAHATVYFANDWIKSADTQSVAITVYGGANKFVKLSRAARKLALSEGEWRSYNPRDIPQLKGASKAYGTVRSVDGVKTTTLGFAFEDVTVTVTMTNVAPQCIYELGRVIISKLSGEDNVMYV